MARLPLSEAQLAQRRSEILDAAMTLLETDGIDAVSLRRVAARLGCSYATPYRYFVSKEHLIIALRARAYRWIEQAMRDAVPRYATPLQKLEALAGAYVRAALEHPARYALMFLSDPKSAIESSSLALAAAKRDALDVCTHAVTEARDAGALRLATDPLTAAHLFWAGAHGLIALQVGGQFVMGRSVDVLIPQMIRTLMLGLEEDAEQQQSATNR